MSKPANWPEGLPYIDALVQRVGVAHMRLLNADYLERLQGILVIGVEKPLAVLMPYEDYIAWQASTEPAGGKK